MPTGVDANFVRFISCIKGFKVKHNNWPTKGRTDSDMISELKEEMDKKDYIKLTNKITLIPDDSWQGEGMYIAEDEEGNAYDLLKYGHPSEDVDALGWLGIKWPDYGRGLMDEY